jgi:hypothetical protein
VPDNPVVPVSRDDWKSEPMASSRQLQYERHLSAIEVNALLEGVKPLAMEDKWFCFAEGEVIHLHRSWTGEEIYSLRLAWVADGTAELAEVRVNNAYPDDGDAADMLDLLFDKILPQYYGD